MTKYTTPTTAVDLVALRIIDGRVHVALIEREYDPYAGSLALPGVFLSEQELVIDALTRAGNKAGLRISGEPVSLGYRDSRDRDPRRRVISLPHVVFNPQYDETTQWFPVSELPDVVFDHSDIICDAVKSVSSVDTIRPLFYDGETPSGAMTAPAVKAILDDVSTAPSAILRTMKKLYTETGDKAFPPGGGRPAVVFV